MLEKLRASTNQIRRGEETKAIAQIKRLLTECIDLAAEMEAKGLADGSRVIDRFVTSVERLHHLGYDSRKISMRPDDDSRTWAARRYAVFPLAIITRVCLVGPNRPDGRSSSLDHYRQIGP